MYSALLACQKNFSRKNSAFGTFLDIVFVYFFDMKEHFLAIGLPRNLLFHVEDFFREVIGLLGQNWIPQRSTKRNLLGDRLQTSCKEVNANSATVNIF